MLRLLLLSTPHGALGTEAMRRALGSGAIPGDRDGCFGGSSGGSS